MTWTVYSPNGRYSTDYEGSWDEYVFRAGRSLAERYADGKWGLGISGAPAAVAALGLGLPELTDYGSGNITERTVDFFSDYVAKNGGSDAALVKQYGPPPARRATYGVDPNSPEAMNLTRQDILDEGEKDRQLSRDITASNERVARIDAASREAVARIDAGARVSAATIDANARIGAVKLQVESDWKIATLQDATDRYIAEGNWGVQRYVAELAEQGAMDRLERELGFREKELAQRAVEAQNQHHANMVSLALEVAKYDDQLAGQPRNWIAYASWLKKRDIVVNGLNLAAAADMVSPEAAARALADDPEAQVTGVAGVGTQTQLKVDSQQQAALVSGQSGGAATPPAAVTPGVQEQANPFAGQEQAAQGYDPNAPFKVGGVDLNSTDYAGMAKQFMGYEGNTQQADVGAMQQEWDQMTGVGRTPGFTSWQGPTKNAVGMEINPAGQKYNYTQFQDLLPTKQEMVVGGVESVRGSGGSADWGKELERSRPKGYTGSGSFGIG